MYGIQQNTTLYFESALLLAMFSFVSTVAYCRFFLRAMWLNKRGIASGNRYKHRLRATDCIKSYLGSLFIFVGSMGMLKLPTLMTRLHAPSKATTLGVGGCLIASMLQL